MSQMKYLMRDYFVTFCRFRFKEKPKIVLVVSEAGHSRVAYFYAEVFFIGGRYVIRDNNRH